MTATVLFEGLTKRFGEVTALDATDLSVESGEFCVFVGPSGCGKTTALRLLSGLERPSSGRIWLGSRDVTEVAAKDRDIAMVFQNYALYPHMTVAENMGFALRMQGKAKPDIGERVRRAAAMLEIEPLLERLPRQLSGGQRQRVAVGRAIVRNPAVFLFDEPLSNLDAKLRNTARAELRELQRGLGTTTVYVTHDQVEAMTMADRIVVMNAGRVEQIGAPLEIYDDPATMFVASFLGSPAMNLVPLSELAPSPDHAMRRGLAPLLERLPAAGSGGLVIGFRPENCRVADAAAGAALGMTGRLLEVERLGAESIMLIEALGQRIAVRSTVRPSQSPGAMLDLAVDPDAVCVFDAISGRRLRSRADPAAALT